jgi:hypothetical protein
MTLVFAKDKSVNGVREALFAGRTVVWYEKQLIGKRGYLEAIFQKAVKIGGVEYGNDNGVRFRVTNHSDVDVELERAGQAGPESLVVPARGTALVRTKIAETGTTVKLPYVVQNFRIGPEKGLPVDLTFPGQLTVDIGVEASAN